MTETNGTHAVRRFAIEALRTVYIANFETGIMTDRQTPAWVVVGEIVADPDVPRHKFMANDALNEWAAGQDPEPPLGMYRVMVREGNEDWTVVHEFEIRRGDIVIDRVQRASTYSDGSTDATTRVIDVISDALVPFEETGA